MTAPELIKLALNISLFLTVLGYGLKATTTEAFYLFRRPGQLFRSILAMNIIMPLFVILITLLFDLAPLIKATLMAIAVSPLAPLFPRRPLQAGGREAYVIGLMVASALLSIVLVPLILEVVSRLFNRPIQVSAQAILVTVLVSIIAPLIAGIALNHFAPSFSAKLINPVTRIGLVLLILAVLPILFRLFPTIIDLIGNGNIVVIAAFVVVGLLVGHFLGGPDQEDRTVLSLATAARHPAIALTVASANTEEQKLVPAAIFLYLIINFLVALPYLQWLRKRKT